MTSKTYDSKAFAAEHKTVAAEFVEAENAMTNGVMFRTAVLTDKAFAAGFLGGKSPVMSPGDYAASFGGKSASWVTKMKRLGRCTRIGFTPDDSEWADLTRDCNAKPVADAIMAENDNGRPTATKTKVRAALRAYRAEQDSKQAANAGKTGSRKARPNEGGKDDGEGQITLTGTTAEKVAVLVTTLSEAVKTLSPDEWIAVEGRLSEIITRENTIRAKVAATPKPKAPKAPTAA